MRLHNLDYLRGLAASSIMFFHFVSFTHPLNSSTVLGRLGIYGVSIFYVLSGLTLYVVYFNRFQLADFARKRIYRIFPLLWVATIAAVVLYNNFTWTDLALSLSGLFGFVKPSAYYAVGAWSIGNELVFYALFPFMIWFARSKMLFLIIAVTALLFIYFSFFVLKTDIPLSSQWENYINPLNHLFFFTSGFLIGLYTKHLSKATSVALIVSGILLFCFYPAGGDQINIVTGFTRLAFASSIIVICVGFYKLKINFGFLHKPLSMLGEASYSVYLLHPFVVAVLNKKLHFLPVVPRIILLMAITLFISYFVYTYFEKYFMAKAHRTKKNIQASASKNKTTIQINTIQN